MEGNTPKKHSINYEENFVKCFAYILAIQNKLFSKMVKSCSKRISEKKIELSNVFENQNELLLFNLIKKTLDYKSKIEDELWKSYINEFVEKYNIVKNEKLERFQKTKTSSVNYDTFQVMELILNHIEHVMKIINCYECFELTTDGLRKVETFSIFRNLNFSTCKNSNVFSTKWIMTIEINPNETILDGIKRKYKLKDDRSMIRISEMNEYLLIHLHIKVNENVIIINFTLELIFSK